jgi:hypothetical protein
VRALALSAEEMATLVDDHASALWRGDEAADSPFYRWLTSCLEPNDTREPIGDPIAVSRLAAGGAGIRWHETATAIVGYVPGVPNARYVVSRFAVPGWLRASN